MKTKDKQDINKIPIWITYESEVEDVIEDTLGKDGPYSGFREDCWGYEILGAYTFKPANTYYYEEVVLDAKKAPDIIHLVVVRYSTGDTFSHSMGKGCVAAIYSKYKDAEDAVKKINEGKWKKYAPWDGYFKSIESVSIESKSLIRK